MNKTSMRASLSAALLSLAGCTALAPVPSAQQLRAACPALAGQVVPASAIGVPSGAATIASATFMPAVPEAVSGNATVAATPDHCKVLGSIAPLDPAAQRIHFQVNLPVRWNGKALQYGGGGYNGVLMTGMVPLRDAAPGDPLPITRGYVTFGTDSGHQASTFPATEPGAFARNDEMLENFAHASYKKVRDVAVEITRRLHGSGPRQLYYFGGSEGGREGLMMAQRYPADYDGIVSVVPVINWTGLFHAFVRNSLPQFDDWLQPAKTGLIAKAAMEACDALDGLVDGVIHNYAACQTRVNLQPLRCPGGADTGMECLSDAELRLVASLHAPYTFGFPLANGVAAYPGWLFGHEDSADQGALHFARWVAGAQPPTEPLHATQSAVHWLYGSNWIRHAIARDPAFDVRGYAPERFQARVQQTSALMDATDPDLSAFFRRGGKLIVRENASDRAQSAAMGFRYYDAVVARLGRSAVEQSMRLYVSPASSHAGGARSSIDQRPVPTMVDLLDPLDRWVTQGRAPADALVQVLRAPTAPFAVQASRPMCRYPAYPHYMGGDRLQAASYACR